MEAVIFTPHMALAYGVILVALVLYMRERVPMELTSLGVVAAFMILFHLFPVAGSDGANRLDATRLLEGFANPALVTVLALLIIGEGLVRTGILDRASQIIFRVGRRSLLSIGLVLIVVATVSGFLNNIPVVVIFIPIMQALADRLRQPTGGLMMPLSFAAILGGMTTLIGSSTNLLVSSALVEAGEAPFAFFDFTVPGLVMAGVGLVYVIGVVPRILPHREGPITPSAEGAGRQFIAQITVSENSALVGTGPVAGIFPNMPAMTLRMIQRGNEIMLPPFEDVVIQPGDSIVVAATRKTLTEVLTGDPGLLGAGDEARLPGNQTLAEAMVTPSSRLIGQTLGEAHFPDAHHCAVLGIRRRSRMIRAQLADIHVEAGDVLLVLGRSADVRMLRSDPEVLLMEWSATDLPTPYYGARAMLIFLGVIACAASGLLPIAVAAVCGAGLMVATGVLSIREATHALDRRIIMMIGTALAMGAALQETGGAAFLAHVLIAVMGDAGPVAVLSAFFLLVALLSNVISTKACAVLFTPIAVDLGRSLGVDPVAFAVAVVFAANCSFASPFGYQTNLLVMTPGQYRFTDFIRAGTPLIFIVWLTFSFFAPWYFGIS